MRILSHYFVARYLGLFATVLVSAFLILATVELVLNFDDLSTFGAASATAGSSAAPNAGFGDIARSLWIRLASYYLADVIPIASFLAVFITFAWAGRAMELVSIQSGGIRLPRIILPVLVTAIILSCATAILHETLILRTQHTWSAREESDRRQPDFGREAFWYHRGRTITNITFADAQTRTLYGVEIFERGETGTIARVIRAEQVAIAVDGVWHLTNASIWVFDPEDPAASPELEQNASIVLDLDARGSSVLLQADPALLPLRDLANFLAADPDMTPSSLRQLKKRFHERLTSPLLVLIFAWLALPFALRVDHRGRFGPPAAAAVAALSTFYLLQSAGTTLAQRELIPIGLTPWLAISMVLLGSAVALRTRRL